MISKKVKKIIRKNVIAIAIVLAVANAILLGCTIAQMLYGWVLR